MTRQITDAVAKAPTNPTRLFGVAPLRRPLRGRGGRFSDRHSFASCNGSPHRIVQGYDFRLTR